jgi:hypothetical protein
MFLVLLIDGLYGPFNLFKGDEPSRDAALPFCDQIPNPKQLPAPNPCFNATIAANAPITAYLACIAYRNDIYLVATLGDVKFCDAGRNGCPKNQKSLVETTAKWKPQTSRVTLKPRSVTQIVLWYQIHMKQ